MAKRILLADDSAVFREALKCALSGPDFAIAAEAGDGFEAMEKVEEEDPDLLLLDVNMPGMDGMEVLKSLKKSRPHLKIVMVTMNSHCIREALEAGADGFCVKDGGARELREAIDGILNGKDLASAD